MKLILLLTPGLALLPAIFACAPEQRDPVPASSDYWNQGKAELARYELSQSRYGEPRAGHAVLVFVAEDFRRDTQVKDERGADPDRSVRVLKLNRIQRFTTGIYDYSLMQSVFTPFDRRENPHTLKTTTSVQDWCGQVWAQLNLDGSDYRFTGHSYFESEADESSELPAALLEDELLNLIRIDPAALPTGEVRVIPGMFDSRLRHRPLQVETGTATVTTDGDRRVYALRYRSGRTLEIRFERQQPHGILGFRETVGDRVTEATRTHVQWTAYWNQGSRRDESARATLGLEAADIGRK